MNAPHRPGSGPRRALRETFAINLRTLSPIAAAITALPVVALFGICLAAHDSLAAIFTGDLGLRASGVIAAIGLGFMATCPVADAMVGVGIAVPPHLGRCQNRPGLPSSLTLRTVLP